MGVAILQPEDCLKQSNPMKHRKSFFPNPNRSNRAQQPNRKKRSPITSPPSPPAAVPKVPTKNLVMGQVKILKRGEDLKKPTPSKSVTLEKEKMGADLGSTNRLGPDPVSVPTLNRLTESINNSNGNKYVIPAPFYAGSAFNVTSPPPTSVPMPAFVTKKVVDATSDLRRILRLDL